jgi:hypothetical protein
MHPEKCARIDAGDYDRIVISGSSSNNVHEVSCLREFEEYGTSSGEQ